MVSSSSTSSPSQHRASLPRKKLTWLLVLAVVIGALGWFGPPAYLQFMKLLPSGATITYSGHAPNARVIDYQALIDGEPVIDAPHCNDGLPRLDCFVDTGDVDISHVITTSAGDKLFELNQDAHSSATLDDFQFFERSDHSVISRDSGFPAPDTESHSTTVLKGSGLVFNTPPQQRDGLHFFFPFNPEKRSYPGFVAGLGHALPVDFVDEVELHGHDAYHFYQRVDAEPIMDSKLKLEGDPDWKLPQLPAATFYTASELAERDLAPTDPLEVSIYLSAKNSYFVESRTGIVLDAQREIYVFAAEDDQQAQQISDAYHHDNEIDDVNTLYYHASALDEDTTQVVTDRADSQVLVLRAMQIFAWFAKTITFVLVAWIVLIILRYRSYLARQ